MTLGELTTVVGNTFIVSGPLGDIIPGEPHGVFAADTRYLSGYQLKLAGHEPVLLRSGAAGVAETHIYATNSEWDDLPPHSIEIIRQWRLTPYFSETIELTNRSLELIETRLDLSFSTDFADIFEVRSFHEVRPETHPLIRCEEKSLTFVDTQRDSERSTQITFSRPPDVIENGSASFALVLKPHECWRLDVQVEWIVPELSTTRPIPLPQWSSTAPVSEWVRLAPKLASNDQILIKAYEQAVFDLGTLEIALNSGYPIPAAGLPWYLAIFGRDSVITSLQTMLLGPRLAEGTLRTLAAYQADDDNPFRDARPGKIAHEIRFGELAVSQKVPHARYYGTVDATPLWLILLGEYYQWTEDRKLVRELLPAAERALDWIDLYGDLDGDGLLEYLRRSERGLQNQGWKDSWDSMRFADGRYAEPPITLVEAQGYAYAAKQSMAGLYDMLNRPDDAQRLRNEAAALKQLVHDAFWMPEEGFYALALDRNKQQVDSITSNPGHLLWSGVLDEPYAGQVVERLLSPEMYSGWGIRTMASTMRAYNPISYHNGSVWPHDNSIIMAGIRRYGYQHEAMTVVNNLIDVSQSFDLGRLPELFCGYDRARTPFPVNYPVACAPQAWASGAIILMLAEMLGLNPTAQGLRSEPAPHGRTLTVSGVPFRDVRLDIRSN